MTAATNTKTYDGTTVAAATPTITSGSIQTGDTAAFTETYSTETVGTSKTLIPAGSVSDGNSGNNYSVAFVNNTTGAITVRTLTVTATGVDKTYDGNTTATVTLSDDRVSGDVFTDSYTSASFSSKHVFTDKTVNVSGISISGTDAANYTLASSTASTTADITACAITVTAATNSKTYDGTTNAAATPTVTSGSIQTGDTAGFTETYSTKTVGTGKTLTPAGSVSDGNSGNNYSVTFVNTTTGVITAAGLTVIGVTAADKTYDGTTVATLSGTPNLNGVMGSDDVSLVTAGATASFADPAVGTNKPVTVTGYTITGADTNNYTLSQPSDLTASILALTTPAFTIPGISRGADGWLLNFTGQSGQTYQVLATVDLSLSTSLWTVLTNGTFGSGPEIVTDSVTNLPARFYRIVSP